MADDRMADDRMAGRFPGDRATPRETARGIDDAIGALKGLGSDEEAGVRREPAGFELPGLQAPDAPVQRAAGDFRDCWSRGVRPLVADGSQPAARPGITAEVHAGTEDRLTSAAGDAFGSLAAATADPLHAAHLAGLAAATADPARAARSPSDIPQVGDPVDVATGDMLLIQQDVSRPGALPLVIGRVYRSSWRAGRWFGPSWASALDQRLQVTPERIACVFADGRILSWFCTADEDGPRPATGLPVSGPRWRLDRAGDGAFTVTDPQAGLVWRFERRPGFYRGPGGAGELPLVAVTDRAGHRIGYEYTPGGQPAWISHSGGYRVRVVMDGNRVTALTLASAREARAAGAAGDAGQPGQEATLVSYGYNPAGDLAAVISPRGQALCFSYDEEGRLTGFQNRNGISYAFSYDRHGRCVAGAGPDGAMSATFAYGDRVTWRTDAAGAKTIYQFDESSRVAAVTDPLGNVTHFWHDEFGRLAARADPLGRLTRYSHDELGNLTAVTRPDGSQVAAGYDEACLPVRLETADGTRLWQQYDPRGRLARRIAPDGAVTSYDYDERGHLASVTGPLGAVTRVECDPAGLPVAVTGPGGGTTRCTRGLFGRVTKIIGPNGAAVELAWTVEGRLAGRVFGDSSSERYDYDAEGNLIAWLSPAGERTSYEYGPSGLVTAMTGPGGTRTEFGYDHGMRLTSVTHASLTWRYSRDAAGRLVAETDYNGATTRYSYDLAGQLIGRVNAVGQQMTCSYDELGRLIGRAADGVVTSFGYDAAGRLVLARNPDAEIRLCRDPLGRVITETCNERAVVSEYDCAGRRGRRVTPGGATEQWEYDDAGRPVRLEAGGQVLRFGYDPAGREIRRDLPGDLGLSQGWDAAGRLASQVLTAMAEDGQPAMPATPPGPGGRVLAGRTYTYRADGCLAGIDDLLAGPRRFTLGSGGRITEVSGPNWAERYAYDPAGNLSSARWTAPPSGAAGSWLAADVQGPRGRAGTLITSAGAVRYRHDKQGRVIQRQRARISGQPATWTYQWDADDRLVAVTTPDGSTWRYRYDAFGRRIAKQRLAPSGATAEETIFSWDGPVLAEAVLAGDSASAPGPGRRRRVTWACRPGTFTPLTQAESVSRDDAPLEVTGERFYAIITDQVGAPAELAGAAGTVAGYQQHTLWGGTLWHPGGAGTPLRFPGQYHDQETGLHYNQQRYYDPVTGSYLTPDPLGLAPAPNPHAYVPSPHILSDPLARLPDPEAATGWGGHEITGPPPDQWPLATEDRWIWSVIARQPGGQPAWLSAGRAGVPSCVPPWPW